jgi:Ca2+-binding EF-hand superfamily protein
MTEDMFRMIDADGNGQVTKDEFARWMVERASDQP